MFTKSSGSERISSRAAQQTGDLPDLIRGLNSGIDGVGKTTTPKITQPKTPKPRVQDGGRRKRAVAATGAAAASRWREKREERRP